MKITERKEIIHTSVEEVIIERKCDICGKSIQKDMADGIYNYFVIHTYHHDWGNDSIDSHEYYDACCPECAMRFAKDYITGAFERPANSRTIEIEHVRTRDYGAC